MVDGGRTLDSAGKRAAFALFYAPLHFLIVSRVVRALQLADVHPTSILDVGCGTGVAGAAWALEAGGSARILGLDRHPWAVEESRWTYRTLGLAGHARQANLERPVPLSPHDAIVVAYTLNELATPARAALIEGLRKATSAGTTVLVVEPVARAVAPWWDDVAGAAVAAGGRADQWRFPLDLPPLVQTFDTAAGLDHREVAVRSLVMRPTAPEIPTEPWEKTCKQTAGDTKPLQRHRARRSRSRK